MEEEHTHDEVLLSTRPSKPSVLRKKSLNQYLAKKEKEHKAAFRPGRVDAMKGKGVKALQEAVS